MYAPQNPTRARERAYVRLRARGATQRAAARAAGYSASGGSSRIEARLAGEIAAERRRLGLDMEPAKLGTRDQPKAIRAELERVVDRWGPRAEALTQQTIRGLASSVTLGAAQDYLSKAQRRLIREQKGGGITARSLALWKLAEQLVAEVRRQAGQPAAEQFSPAQKPSQGSTQNGAHTREAGREADAPLEPRCKAHPSIVLAKHPDGCPLCALARAATRRPPDDDLDAWSY